MFIAVLGLQKVKLHLRKSVRILLSLQVFIFEKASKRLILTPTVLLFFYDSTF